MPTVLRLREYVEAANLARERARTEGKPHAKQLLQEIERCYRRLLEIEKWAVDQQNNITARLRISGCSTITRRRPPRARTSCLVLHIKIGALRAKAPALPDRSRM